MPLTRSPKKTRARARSEDRTNTRANEEAASLKSMSRVKRKEPILESNIAESGDLHENEAEAVIQALSRSRIEAISYEANINRQNTCAPVISNQVSSSPFQIPGQSLCVPIPQTISSLPTPQTVMTATTLSSYCPTSLNMSLSASSQQNQVQSASSYLPQMYYQSPSTNTQSVFNYQPNTNNIQSSICPLTPLDNNYQLSSTTNLPPPTLNLTSSTQFSPLTSNYQLPLSTTNLLPPTSNLTSFSQVLPPVSNYQLPSASNLTSFNYQLPSASNLTSSNYQLPSAS